MPNLLDRRLRHRGGSDYLAALKTDSVVNDDARVLAVPRGLHLTAGTDLDIADSAGDPGFSVFAGGVYTAWVVFTPETNGNWYLGVDVFDLSGNPVTGVGYSTPSRVPIGRRSLKFTTLAVAANGRLGLDFGSAVIDDPPAAIVHDIGITPGRVPSPRVGYTHYYR